MFLRCLVGVLLCLLVGIVRARDAGAVKPLLLVQGAPKSDEYSRALEVSLLSALAGLYEVQSLPLRREYCTALPLLQPLQARETVTGLEPVQEIGFWVGTRIRPSLWLICR